MSIHSKKRRDLKRKKKESFNTKPRTQNPCEQLADESMALLQRGEPQKALELALQVVVDHEGHNAWERACHTALEILLDWHDASRALPLAERVVKHNPACPLGYFQLACALQLKGEHDRALKFFQKALEISPTQFVEQPGPEHVKFARAATDSGHTEVLNAWIERWEKEPPSEPDTQYFWALVLYEAGRVSEARRILEALLKAEPQDVENAAILHELGMCAHEEGELDKARDYYLEAAKSGQENRAVPFSMLATLEIDAGNPEQAIVWAERALKIDPHNISIRVNLAAAFASAGQFNAAVAEYRRISSAIPDPRIRQSMAFALIEAGEYDKGIKELQRLIDVGFNETVIGVNIGVALAMRGQPGDLEEAVALHRRALTKTLVSEQLAGVHLNLVHLLARSGNFEAALQHADSISSTNWSAEHKEQLQESVQALRAIKKNYVRKNIELIDDGVARYVRNISINVNVQAGGIAHIAAPGETVPTGERSFVQTKSGTDKMGKEAAAKGMGQGELADYNPEEQPWFVAQISKIEPRSKDKLGPILSVIEVVLMTVKQDEMRAALARMMPLSGEAHVLRVRVEQETYYIGQFGNHSVALTICMPGSTVPGAAILAAKHGLDFWKPKAVIMVGFAFGRDPDSQKIADVLVSEQVISYEQQRIGPKNSIPRGPVQMSGSTLLNRFRFSPDWFFLRPDGTKCELRSGPILSGEKLVDNLKFKEKLFKRYPQAIGGE